MTSTHALCSTPPRQVVITAVFALAGADSYTQVFV
jgi:hypothetical protein